MLQAVSAEVCTKIQHLKAPTACGWCSYIVMTVGFVQQHAKPCITQQAWKNATDGNDMLNHLLGSKSEA